jgi:hypothetical protein
MIYSPNAPPHHPCLILPHANPAHQHERPPEMPFAQGPHKGFPLTMKTLCLCLFLPMSIPHAKAEHHYQGMRILRHHKTLPGKHGDLATRPLLANRVIHRDQYEIRDNGRSGKNSASPVNVTGLKTSLTWRAACWWESGRGISGRAFSHTVALAAYQFSWVLATSMVPRRSGRPRRVSVNPGRRRVTSWPRLPSGRFVVDTQEDFPGVGQSPLIFQFPANQASVEYLYPYLDISVVF